VIDDPALHRRLYCALHRGRDEDAPFYRRVCEGCTSVLELGVGDGRILAELAAVERVGLDADPAMLEAARGRVPDARFVRADMASFELGRRFERILIPSSALFALPGPEAQRACFERVAAHLAPRGEAWLDAYASDAFHDEACSAAADPARAELEPLGSIDVEGASVRVFEANAWSREAQRFDVVYWFDWGDRVVEQTLVHHYLRSEQVRDFAAGAGLRVIAFDSDFFGTPFERDAEHMVVGLRRP